MYGLSSRAECLRWTFPRCERCSASILLGLCPRTIPAARFRSSTGSTTRDDSGRYLSAVINWVRKLHVVRKWAHNGDFIGMKQFPTVDNILPRNTYRNTMLLYPK